MRYVKPERIYLKGHADFNERWVQRQLEEAGIDLMEYNTRDGRYKLHLAKGDAERHAPLLTELFRSSYNAFTDAA